MKKHFRRILSLFMCLACLFPLMPVSRGLSANAFCLMDADTGDVLFASREDEEQAMASTTKIMTCLVAIREGDLHQTVEIPAAAVGIEGSSVYLSAGEKLTLLDLLYALMLQSANDAAVAIALAVSGSVDEFAHRMNATASEIGLNHTFYKNPHGLPAEGHYSTAKDLCLLMAFAMKDEVFASITGEVHYRIPAPDGNSRYLVNHNKLLRQYDECVGGKTGFTKSAGRCLVTCARRNGKTLVCSTLNAPDDWNDHRNLYQDGFGLYHEVELCAVGSVKMDLPVVGGEVYVIPVGNLEGAKVMVRGDGSVTEVIELPRFLYAPVPGIEVATDGDYVLRRAGVSVGRAVYYQNGREVASVSLYPLMNVAASQVKKNFFQRIGDWFRSVWEWLKGLWKK